MLAECSECGAQIIITSSIRYTLDACFNYLCAKCEKALSNDKEKEIEEDADLRV